MKGSNRYRLWSGYLFFIQNPQYNPIKYSTNCQTAEAVETARPAIWVEQDLDTLIATSYNIHCAEVAQLVEQRTENPRVPSSILGLGTKIRAEVVQR